LFHPGEQAGDHWLDFVTGPNDWIEGFGHVLLPAAAFPALNPLEECFAEMPFAVGYALKDIAAGKDASKRIRFASRQVMGNFTVDHQSVIPTGIPFSTGHKWTLFQGHKSSPAQLGLPGTTIDMYFLEDAHCSLRQRRELITELWAFAFHQDQFATRLARFTPVLRPPALESAAKRGFAFSSGSGSVVLSFSNGILDVYTLGALPSSGKNARTFRRICALLSAWGKSQCQMSRP
jgi:hypothetical protein